MKTHECVPTKLVGGKMSFCDQLWNENQDIIQKIANMDFIKEMYEGTLSDDVFHYYLEQDIDYLNDYAKASAYLLTKSQKVSHIKFFLELAQGTFAEQERVHESYDFIRTDKRTPAYHNYSNFILSHTAMDTIGCGYASILACPWLYIYLGEVYTQKTFTNDKYLYWFEANCVPEIQEFLKQQKAIMEEFANDFPHEQPKMKKLFREAMFHEYEFWNDAHRRASGFIG